MAKRLKLLKAEKVKQKLDKSDRQQIKHMYTVAANEIDKKIKNYSKRDNISSVLLKSQMENLREQITNELSIISSGLSEITHSAMTTMSTAIVDANKEMLVSMGFSEASVTDSFVHVPQEVVKIISTGRVYDTKWYLSEAIWGAEKETLKVIDQLIAIGTAQGSSSFDIAKMVEGFVNPSVAKPSKSQTYYVYYDQNGRKVRDIRGLSEEELSKLKKVKKTFNFGNVDYNAQRLARTLVSHAYQQANILAQKENPWVEKFEWRSAMVHGRTCQICMARDGQQYDKDKVPMDHPNGLCTIFPVLTKSLKDIASELADWTTAKPGTYPQIDKYANDMFSGQKDVKEKIEKLKSEFKK